jgi:hypothetical protein
MKFKYDSFNSRLSRLEDEYAYEISEEQGFVLDTNRPNH